MKRLRFFIDFDGTITQQDVIDTLLERFASKEWQVLEKEWREGRMGSRDCLSKQLALVKASRGELKSLVEEIEIDPSFLPFIKKARSLNVPVSVVSDGLDWVIESVFRNVFRDDPKLLEGLSIFSNGLEWTEQGIRMTFPPGPVCENGCANCKVRIMKRETKKGESTVFVGDGLSDRFAAGAADLTFAKNELLDFCREKKIRHKAYAGFGEIGTWLSNELQDSPLSKSLAS